LIDFPLPTHVDYRRTLAHSPVIRRLLVAAYDVIVKVEDVRKETAWTLFIQHCRYRSRLTHAWWRHRSLLAAASLLPF